MLYALIGAVSHSTMKELEQFEVEITIITPYLHVAQDIHKHLSACQQILPVVSKDIQINYIYDTLRNSLNTVDLKNKYKGYFNYIEYYGPTGDIDSITNELNHLKEVMQLINDIYLK